jgi:ATP-dependent helicase/DNAse subunit B
MQQCEKTLPRPPAGWTTHLEEAFSFESREGARIRGRIDRYDRNEAGAARAYDYKYSKSSGLKEKYVQGGLYVKALAAQDPPVTAEAFYYVALREDANLTAFEGERLIQIVAQVETDVRCVVDRVAEGSVAVRPADRANCQYCDYFDVCRIQTMSRLEEEEQIAEAAE